MWIRSQSSVSTGACAPIWLLSRVLVVALAAALSLSTARGQNQGQDMDAKSAIDRLFRDGPAEADWFAPGFLDQVPLSRVRRLVDELKGRFGPLREVRQVGDRLLVRLEGAEVPARLAFDDAGRIAGLWLETAIPTGNLEQHVAAIAALPGRSALLVLTDGRVRAAHNAALPLAVGSAAKLAVLKAVEDAVAAGRFAWDSVVPLEPGWRSLPTGILQDWPAGTPLTIATLANLMISLSDNTATDALIDLVGREAVEAVTPRNTPFPTTRELFTLKAAEEERRRAWINGDPAERRALLARIVGKPLPAAAALPGASIEIEWFMTANELCTLLDETADLPALHIDPSLARADSWQSVAFKGGSEPGVLNLSTRLVAPDGTTHCVVATWNGDAALDEARLLEPYRAVLQAVGAP